MANFRQPLNRVRKYFIERFLTVKLNSLSATFFGKIFREKIIFSNCLDSLFMWKFNLILWPRKHLFKANNKEKNSWRMLHLLLLYSRLSQCVPPLANTLLIYRGGGWDFWKIIEERDTDFLVKTRGNSYRGVAWSRGRNHFFPLKMYGFCSNNAL